MTYIDYTLCFVSLVDELNYLYKSKDFSESTWQCEFGDKVDMFEATFIWFDSLVDNIK